MSAWTVLLAIGCGGGQDPADHPVRSRPTPPTVVFEQDPAKDVGIVWTDLEGLFPERPGALPASLAALEPGTNGARAREILDAAHEPGARIFGEMVESDLVVSSILKGMNTVQVSVVLADEGKSLREVHVELPDDVATPMLTTRWGEAAEVVHADGGNAHYTWRSPGSPWQATLYPAIAPDRALVRYTPVAPPAGGGG